MNRAAKISAVTRIGCLWDATLVTDDGFGARMCKKCVQSHRFGLGSEWGGGGGRGGSANREPGSYIPMCVCVCVDGCRCRCETRFPYLQSTHMHANLARTTQCSHKKKQLDDFVSYILSSACLFPRMNIKALQCVAKQLSVHINPLDKRRISANPVMPRPDAFCTKTTA